MAITEVYSDIDASLEKNTQKDIAKLININAIRQALYNRLMISASELPFDNSERQSLREYVHADNDPFTNTLIKETVDRAAYFDDRLSNVTVSIKDSFTLSGALEKQIYITATVNYANGLRQNIDFTIILDNY